MAQSPGGTGADEPAEDESAGRSPATEALWSDLRIDPVEIALPAGVGYTLRAYRLSTELAPVEFHPDAQHHQDDFDVAAAEVLARRRAARAESAEEAAEPDEELAEQPAEAGDLTEEEEEEAAEEEAAEEEAEPEEVPAFLSRAGRLLLFRSQQGLVEFVQSGSEHQLAQLDTWKEFTHRVTEGDIAPRPDDSYELDLVVENLRAGPDAWDAVIVMKAGELARDLGYALRMEQLLTALAPGSPLDELDETLRAVEAGGIGGFLAKRRLRKITGQQAALGWRTIVGKISAAVDWRD